LKSVLYCTCTFRFLLGYFNLIAWNQFVLDLVYFWSLPCLPRTTGIGRIKLLPLKPRRNTLLDDSVRLVRVPSCHWWKYMLCLASSCFFSDRIGLGFSVRSPECILFSTTYIFFLSCPSLLVILSLGLSLFQLFYPQPQMEGWHCLSRRSSPFFFFLISHSFLHRRFLRVSTMKAASRI